MDMRYIFEYKEKKIFKKLIGSHIKTQAISLTTWKINQEQATKSIRKLISFLFILFFKKKVIGEIGRFLCEKAASLKGNKRGT